MAENNLDALLTPSTVTVYEAHLYDLHCSRCGVVSPFEADKPLPMLTCSACCEKYLLTRGGVWQPLLSVIAQETTRKLSN